MTTIVTASGSSTRRPAIKVRKRMIIGHHFSWEAYDKQIGEHDPIGALKLGSRSTARTFGCGREAGTVIAHADFDHLSENRMSPASASGGSPARRPRGGGANPRRGRLLFPGYIQPSRKFRARQLLPATGKRSGSRAARKPALAAAFSGASGTPVASATRSMALNKPTTPAASTSPGGPAPPSAKPGLRDWTHEIFIWLIAILQLRYRSLHRLWAPGQSPPNVIRPDLVAFDGPIVST